LASIHSCPAIIDCLEENDLRVLPRMVKGADMSPIENVFNELKRLLAKHQEYTINQNFLFDFISRKKYQET
jgi:hypothetical protein